MGVLDALDALDSDEEYCSAFTNDPPLDCDDSDFTDRVRGVPPTGATIPLSLDDIVPGLGYISAFTSDFHAL